MVKKLTAKFVETVKPGSSRAEYRDAKTPGLIFRVTANGAKSWSVIYTRLSDGKKRRITIGTLQAFSLSEARAEAHSIIAKVARGGDPAGDQQAFKGALTFSELADHWVKRHGKPNKSPRALHDDQLMLKGELLPAIGQMKADQIKKRDIIRIIDAVAERGAKYRSNRVLALVRSIFRWACAEDIIQTDPTQGIRPRTVERARERVLNEEEISVFWHKLKEAPMSKSVATILKLALVTGQRIGEIAGMTKAEIDLSYSNPMWKLPGGRTKNKQVSRVPLAPLAKALIKEALSRSGDSSYVFPSPTGNGPISAHAATRAMGRSRSMLGIENIRAHDLRRTAATSMASLGINPHTISLVLDHTSVSKGTVTGAVYVKYSFDREKREALELWSEYLQGIISGDGRGKIIELKR